MLGALVVVLLAALIVASTFFWLGRRDSATGGTPELIQAPPGPYKVKPENPGGLDISAESETAFETSAGEDRNSQLDTSKLPKGVTIKPAEEQNTAAAAEKPAPPPKKPVEPQADATPAGG